MLKQVGRLLAIGLLAGLPGCGSHEGATLAPHELTSLQNTQEIFDKRHQSDKLYLTERTSKKIIRPGNVSVPFVDEETKELCWPALTCINPDCPGKRQDGNPFLFVHSDPLVTVDAQGLPVYPRVDPGQDYAKLVSDAGGFPDATCPACYEKFRRGRSETAEEKDRYASYVVDFELRERTQQQWALAEEAQARIVRSSATSLVIQNAPDPTASPSLSSSAELTASEEGQRAVSLAGQITGPLIKGGAAPEATALLRHVLKDTKEPQVRAAIVAGLAKARDPDSVPQLLDIMEDESLEVRRLAAIGVEGTCGFPSLFQTDAPLEKRQEVISRYRKIWDSLVNAPGQPYIRMMKDPAFREAQGRRAMEKLRELRAAQPPGQ